MTKSERGILSEWQVACHRRKFHGEKLIAHRLRTPFAEVDLLMHHMSAANFTLFEVKTDASYMRDAAPLSRQQGARLNAAREYLEDELASPVALVLALVSHAPESAVRYRVRYFDLLT